ncbi:regulatory protein-modification [Caudoviricetes sp.]|nr:regulatory protein-modification [Caudoviricetes sp.]
MVSPDRKQIRKELGAVRNKELIYIMEANNLRHEDVAELTGLSIATIAKYTTNKLYISQQNLNKIEEKLK